MHARALAVDLLSTSHIHMRPADRLDEHVHSSSHHLLMQLWSDVAGSLTVSQSVLASALAAGLHSWRPFKLAVLTINYD